jgi:hypothetical protein
MMGEGPRPETVAAERGAAPHPEIILRRMLAWSLATLAAIAAGFVLYAAREVMLPIVAAFVVGVMLGPAARRLEAARAPRIAAGGELDADHLSRDPLDFPSRVRADERLAGHRRVAKGKLHVFDGLVAAWRRLTSMIVEPPNKQAPTSTLWSRASDRAGVVARAAQLQVVSLRHYPIATQLQASWIGDTFEDRVRERPLPTVALALGPGFLIGLTFRR